MPFIPKKELENLFHAGRMMSNLCFSLRKSTTLRDSDRASMEQAFKDWDKAQETVRLRVRKVGR